MRVLVCPDKFRGTLSALQAAAAIGRGWSRARPTDEIRLLPLADGGEGTLDALVPPGTTGGQRITTTVPGPCGDPVDAAGGLQGSTGVVELAAAAGLGLVPPDRRDPRRTTTAGVGASLRAVLDRGVERVLVGLGGSGTNDGGVGLARVFGVSFRDERGRELAEGGAALASLAHIDAAGRDPHLDRVAITGLVDVDAPLCGPRGASVVFAPQKGASARDVVELDAALERLAEVVRRDLGVDARDVPGAGAAGGTGYGLIAFCGAVLRPGAEAVMEAVGFSEALGDADLVITGEGSLDASSLAGKVPSAVLRAARLAGVRVAIVCGAASVRPDGAEVRSLAERVGAERALADAAASVELVAAELAAAWAEVPA